MISQIRIENFQSHAESTLDLHPGLTVIVGTSNSGKTAIIRALRWIATNRPRGSGIIRHGAKVVEATVILKDGTTITRRKSKSKNEYVVNGEVLEALGSDVPGQVKALLDLTDLNLADQLESHYLILDSPGKIAKAVNQAVHLEDGERCRDKLAAEVRRASGDVKRLSEELERAEQKSAGYVGLDEYACKAAEARRLDEARAKVGQDVVVLEAILRSLAEIETGGPPDPEPLAAMVSGMMAEVEGHRRVEDRFSNLSWSVRGLRDVEDDGILLGDPDGLSVQAKAARTLVEAARIASKDVSLLIGVIGSLRDLKGLERDIEARQEDAADEYNDLLAELDVCPSCGQDLDEQARGVLLG